MPVVEEPVRNIKIVPKQPSQRKDEGRRTPHKQDSGVLDEDFLNKLMGNDE